MKKFGFVLLLILGLFTACKTTNTITSFTKVKQVIETNQWVLQDESGSVKGMNDQNVTLNFRNENGLKINGFAGCNAYQGDVALTEGAISFGDINSTKVYCPQSIIENSFFETLRQTNRYELTGKSLSLYKGKILLVTLKAL